MHRSKRGCGGIPRTGAMAQRTLASHRAEMRSEEMYYFAGAEPLEKYVWSIQTGVVFFKPATAACTFC